MPENSRNKRSGLLILNLVLIIACISGLILSIGFYPVLLSPEPTFTPTSSSTIRPTSTPSQTPIPTIQPSNTRTPLPSLTLTHTSTPTRTGSPTVSVTPPGPPTLTPARPLFNSGSYDLVSWSPENAEHLIDLMRDYPNTLPLEIREEDQSAYFQAFQYATIAEQEALLRFPDAPQASEWRWMLAYDFARIGDPRAGQEYADLISQGLNSGEVELNYLYAWFPTKEPNLSLFMVELPPLPGYIGAYLIEIRGHGGAFFWLLQSTSGYRVFPLVTNFDFVNNPQASWIIADLNGNEQAGEEIAIYSSTPPGEYFLDPPDVFSLTRIPASKLDFLPPEDIFQIGMEFRNYWAVESGSNDINSLVFDTTVYPACPIEIRRIYSWNGLYFGLEDESYSLEELPPALEYCQGMVDFADGTWGPVATIPLMEALLPVWPPEQDVNGNPYPPDVKDEWRYRLGVNYALIGEMEEAKSYFQDVVSEPAIFNSSWIEPSQRFLETYQQPDDVYRACVEAEFCNPAHALEFLIDNIEEGADPLEYLRQSGASPISSGFFDFDMDEESERWFTIRHRTGENLQFWIIADSKNGPKTLQVSDVSTTKPDINYLDEAFIDDDSLYLQPVVFLDGSTAFSMQRFPDNQEPYLMSVGLREEYPSPFFTRLDEAETALFSGVPPSIVQEQLLDLATWPGLLCKSTWSCDSYYYFLGLSSELAGEDRAAVEAYHRLWSDYSKSPFTTMARLKLSGEPLVSATPTPSITLTPSPIITPTPTVTGTPPTMTPTTSITATTLETGIAYPSPTNTLTETYPTP